MRRIVDGVRKLHAIDFRGVDEALHVLAKAENGRPLLGFVAANAFENRGAVADDVRKDVQRGVVPVDPLSVVPDFFGLGEWHKCSLLIVATAGCSKLQNTVAGGRRQCIRWSDVAGWKTKLAGWASGAGSVGKRAKSDEETP